MNYLPSDKRYDHMRYNRCGKSGIQLPVLSLGLWQNFGGMDVFENGRQIIRTAFDHGIIHFDLANNYGPPYGSAEENFGHILKKDLMPYRDELVIATKAGFDMWPGPYGNWGSKKYLISSLDQSLTRMNLNYVDIFYHHRPDPETPLEETMSALDQIVRQGKALYIGLSNYKPAEMRQAIEILEQLGTPCLLHQPRYSMLDRWVEEGLLDLLEEKGIGCISFSPLAQGVLTNKYLNGIPENSRAAKKHSTSLLNKDLTEEKLNKIIQLNSIAEKRGMSLAQMAIGWLLKDKRITSVLIGASSSDQLLDSLKVIGSKPFNDEELLQIENILQ